MDASRGEVALRFSAQCAESRKTSRAPLDCYPV
jgi:hypothetical protein